MSWRPAGRGISGSLERFLRIEEWKHTNLSSRIRLAGEKPRFGQIADGRLWIYGDGSRIDGALFISRFGVVLPAHDPESAGDADREFLRRLLVPRRDRIFSMIGTAVRVNDLEARLGESAGDAETYRIFTGENRAPSSLESGFPELTLHRADAGDLDRLWPLEKAYQLEEVLRRGSILHERSGRRHFLETLRSQMVFYASLNGRPVAKAGTNARGWNWDQVGGVFVIPELRGSGFGGIVMKSLMAAIRDEGKSPCLFVKDSNPAALALYNGLGFADRGAFRISYWSG